MGQTLAEKIFSAHCGRTVTAGEFVIAPLDLVMAHDTTCAWALEPFARETLSAANLERQGFFDPAAASRVLDAHVSGHEDFSRQLWGLLAFTLWYERHVERSPADVRVPEVLVER